MFVTDTRTEKLLDAWGLKWEWSNSITLKMLVPNWQNANKGRSKAKIEEAILNYAQRCETGSRPPGAVLYPIKLGLDPLDGVQRLCVAELLGWGQFGSYIVKTDSHQLALAFRIMANSLLAGQPETQEWTKREAVVNLIINGTMKPEDVARLGGWKLNEIVEEQKIQEWGFKIRCAGGPEKLPKNVLLTIDKHAQIDIIDKATRPVIAFINALKQGKFTNGESEPYIKDFFTGPFPKNRTLYKSLENRFETFQENPEIKTRLQGRPQRRIAHDVNLISAMKTALTRAENVIHQQKAVPYIDECYRLWNKVSSKLDEIKNIPAKKVRQ